MTTKSQTDNTELDEIKKTVWECIRYNEFNLSDTEAVGVIMQAVEAKLQEQDIKSRIDAVSSMKQRFHEPIEHDGSYISISIIDEAFDEQLAKLRSKA